jgi:hypothetical protein
LKEAEELWQRSTSSASSLPLDRFLLFIIGVKTDDEEGLIGDLLACSIPIIPLMAKL